MEAQAALLEAPLRKGSWPNTAGVVKRMKV
jgi:hypothetical protein